jgi:predicted anti-sigma-YlaC factor YlaD
MSEHVEDRLTAYPDGALDPADSERIRAHLESCSTCRSAYEEHARFEMLLTEATQEFEPSSSLWPGIAGRLESPRMRLRLAGGMAFAAAAGVALALLLPGPTPTAAADTDLWTALGYGLIDGEPAALAAFDEGGHQ